MPSNDGRFAGARNTGDRIEREAGPTAGSEGSDGCFEDAAVVTRRSRPAWPLMRHAFKLRWTHLATHSPHPWGLDTCDRLTQRESGCRPRTRADQSLRL